MGVFLVPFKVARDCSIWCWFRMLWVSQTVGSIWCELISSYLLMRGYDADRNFSVAAQMLDLDRWSESLLLYYSKMDMDQLPMACVMSLLFFNSGTRLQKRLSRAIIMLMKVYWVAKLTLKYDWLQNSYHEALALVKPDIPLQLYSQRLPSWLLVA